MKCVLVICNNTLEQLGISLLYLLTLTLSNTGQPSNCLVCRCFALLPSVFATYVLRLLQLVAGRVTSLHAAAGISCCV